jgi:hypothetical protein
LVRAQFPKAQQTQVSHAFLQFVDSFHSFETPHWRRIAQQKVFTTFLSDEFCAILAEYALQHFL